jgi:hypothetical protein
VTTRPPLGVTVRAAPANGIAAPAAIAAAKMPIFPIDFLIRYTSLELYYPTNQ